MKAVAIGLSIFVEALLFHIVIQEPVNASVLLCALLLAAAMVVDIMWLKWEIWS